MPSLTASCENENEKQPHLRTIPTLLEERARELGDRTLLRIDEHIRSFKQMRDAAAQYGSKLRAAGLDTGDRVAIMSENRIEVLDYLLGSAWIGAIAMPLNTSLRGEALRHQLTDAAPTLIVAETDYRAVIDNLDMDVTPTIWELPTVWEAERGPLAEPAVVRPGDTAVILYTSGTTGPAKGVECPHAQFYWWGSNVSDQLELTPDDVLYTCLAMYHVNALGTFFQALVTGCSVTVGPRFSASRMWSRLKEANATVTYLLGNMVAILASREENEEDRSHCVTRALAPGTPARLIGEFQERFGIALVESYGSTETNAVLGAPINGQRPGWIGQCRPGFEAIVADDNDEALPDGEGGQLLVRASQPFAFATGYVGNSQKTVEARRNLWFHTGDRVARSDDGWFKFLDRMSDSIRRSGENISGFEVEQVVLAHDDVELAAAYGLPSEMGEEEVAIGVVLRQGSMLTEEEIVRWCDGRMAYFAVPRYVLITNKLPTTPQGKVRKSELRAAGKAICWDRNDFNVVVSRGI